MQELRKVIESNIGAINKQIVDTQKEIDELFESHLNNPFDAMNETKRNVRNQDKFYYYGWLGALESVLKIIDKLEEQDKLDFELALEQLEITERELKADCPF
ncbi:MAG: hypothetical protein J6D47_15245 [Peptostreptococcaceae bacterium]|nr:hypothetical protein [Peptostreptococcaceae bacterium]